MTVRIWALALAGAMVLGGPVAAQQRRGGPSPGDRVEMERRIQERFAEVVRVQLDLDADRAEVLGESALAFQRERLALLRREGELRRRLRSDGGGPLADRSAPLLPEAEAREVLAEMRALRAAETELYNREQDRLLELLTPGQLVRYYLLREHLAEAIGRLRGAPPGGRLQGDRSPLLRRQGSWWRRGRDTVPEPGPPAR